MSGVTKPLVLLLLVVALVLLLTCANVANLLLARAGARRREIAIRLATGASRSRLVRQLMTESLLLAGLGGLAGLLVARWGVDFLLAYQPAGGSLDVERGLDPFVMSAAVALTLLTGLAFGLAPAWRATRADVVPALKGAEPRTVERMFGWRGALVVFQVAISLVLVVGAALFLRSMRNLRAVDIGFRPGPVLLAAVDLEQGGYDHSRGATFLTQLLDRLAAAPGVEIATAAAVITPNPGGSNWSGVALEGFTPAAGEDVSFDVNKVGPRYFEAMGIALVRGRGFTAGDRDGAPRVAVVNESFARRYYPGADPDRPAHPSGRRCRGGRHRDRRHRPRREIPRSSVRRVRRPSISPCSRATRHRSRWCCGRAVTRSLFPVRCAGRSARWTPGSRCSMCAPWPTHVASATAQDRMIATLSTLFGVMALSLAALGLFGVLATTVAQRTREIGVRIALGARSSQVVVMMLRRAASLVAVGLLIGSVAALVLGRFAADLLYGIAPADPAAFGVAALLLAAAAALASYFPARRAARVDPMVALRPE